MEGLLSTRYIYLIESSQLILKSKYYELSFADMDTKAQRNQVIGLKSHNQKGTAWEGFLGLNAMSVLLMCTTAWLTCLLLSWDPTSGLSFHTRSTFCSSFSLKRNTLQKGSFYIALVLSTTFCNLPCYGSTQISLSFL